MLSADWATALASVIDVANTIIECFGGGFDGLADSAAAHIPPAAIASGALE
jgi:hypothetical protein